MAVSPLVRPLGIAAGVSASIQGLAWSVLALLGILVYAEAWRPELQNISVVSQYLYLLFLTDGAMLSLLNIEITMRGENMIIFMSIFLAFSLVWMIVSLCLIWIAVREKWQFAKLTLIIWTVCTGLVTIMDIVAMSLFAADYAYLKGYFDDGILPFQAVSAASIMMVIAARGFVLLIANVIFAVLFGYWGFTFEEQENHQPKRELINGYEQSRPPTWLGNGNVGGLGRPYSNPSYEPEMPERPVSYERQRYNRSPPSENFARIGRSNLKQSPQPSYQPPQPSYQPPQPSYQPPPRQRGPYIPEPDYSPTSLRKHPKSVLKSRNHY